MRQIRSVILAGALVAATGASRLIVVDAQPAVLRFAHRPIEFTLQNSETPARYAPETMAGGVALFDFDNDGDLDVYFANGAELPSLQKTSPKYRNKLFRNDGRANFVDVTEKSGLAGTGYDIGVAIADYDNDGDEDIFVGGVHTYTLYRNNGNGTFTDVTKSAGLTAEDSAYGRLWSVGGAWVDANSDGLLDLFVTNYLSWSPETEPECNQSAGRDYCHPRYYKGTPNRLYLGTRQGTFTDVSVAAGIRNHVGKGMGAAIGDADGDGLVDIFVTNDKLANFFFRNAGNGRYREQAFAAAVAYREDGRDISGMGADFRDVDNDGLPDIVFTALGDETFPFFRNTAKGYFEDATVSSRMHQLSLPMSGFGAGIYDFDNDGRKDVFVARGHVQSQAMSATLAIDQHNTVFRNLADGTFEALTGEAGFTAQPPRRHRGSAHGDLNNDGRIDVVVTALGASAEVWLNESPASHHWLMVKLVGTVSNRNGIGASVKVVAGGQTQFNHVTTAVGYASASPSAVHFGLGTADTADAIEVRWPSGRVQQLTKVKGNRTLEIRER